MNCTYVGANEPRIIKGRHGDDCWRDGCTGCQPCTEPHCRVCGREHAEQSCAGCLAAVRDDLAAIATMCRALPAEVEHRGVDSEAMALLGPAADPEAWGHITTSLHVGRLPVGYLACDRCENPWPCEKHADSELHPLFVLGTWDMVWRDALDHETDAELTVPAAVEYLSAQMTYMAGFADAPFEDFARDLRRCRAHMESVLHDGEQVETGAPCMKCETALLRIYAGREMPWSSSEHPALAHEDGWACPRCKRWHTPEQYRLAVAESHRESAEWLTDVDMEARARVKASTVRSWARADSPTPIKKRQDAGRIVYLVADVIRVRDEKAAKTRGEVLA